MKGYEGEFLISAVERITQDTFISIASYGKVKDFAIKNIGATDALLYGYFPLNVGDGLISFAGYDDVLRNDNFQIQFAGGVGEIIILYTRYQCD
jgi:hypothetical protein